MKKILLMAPALLAAIGANSQNKSTRMQTTGITTMAEIVGQRFSNEFLIPPRPVKSAPVVPAGEEPEWQEDGGTAAAAPPTNIVWKMLCGSMNCYGMLVSNSKPLQYNAKLNAVTFVHRKSIMYQPAPAVPANAESGVIVAEVSSNWGSTWDSTCIWANSTNWGRYPQGAIYSPPLSNNIADAYFVGSGPTVAGSNFSGNFYASKKLAAPGSSLYNSTADATPGAQQFLSFSLGSYPPNQGPHSWSRYGFTTTNDGAVRSLALIQGTNNTLGDDAKMRGVAVVRGTFNAGVFTWIVDSLIPNAIVTSSGVAVLSSDVQMAFDTSGTVGYVMMIGAKSNAVLSNRGYQPIVYKTDNAGQSWSMINSIDFNSPSMSSVTNRLAGVVDGNDTISVPYFNNYDMVVDSSGKLHIGATVCSGAIAHNDSLNYIAQYTNQGVKYLWKHVNGSRPYVYDFIGDGNGPWTVRTIDSISTEDPGAGSSAYGYSLNPWDNSGTNGARINMDSRLQMGRTPLGNFITFSWAESDTAFTPYATKFNVYPNLKSRCLAARGAVSAYSLSPTEINISKPAAGHGSTNSLINNRATLHYMSPTTSAATLITASQSYTADIKTPFSVTNSFPYSQLDNNTTWFTAAHLSYVFTSTVIGLPENTTSSRNLSVYPNPVKDKVNIAINLTQNEKVEVRVYDLIGQNVKSLSINGEEGENAVVMNMHDLTQGVYFINIKAGNSSVTKKVVVE